MRRDRLAPDEPICEHTDLLRATCAHCTGATELRHGDRALTTPTYDARKGTPIGGGEVSAPLFNPGAVTLPGWGQPCTSCGALAGESYLCPRCVEQLEVDCANAPMLLDQLEVAITRMDRVYRPSPPPDAEAGESMPFNVAASTARDELRWALVTGTLALLSRVGRQWEGADDPAAVASWLGRHSASVALHPEGDQIAQQVRSAVAKALRVIDTTPERVLAGPCPTCGSRLMAFKGAVKVWCDTCAERHAVADLQAPLRAKVHDLAYTVSGLRDLARSLGIRCDSKRVEHLVERGHLTRAGESSDGHAVYRVGDFLAELDRQEVLDQQHGVGVALP